jgi:hypothetical protein
MIYEVKRDGKTPHDAKRLALQYGITAKAVRDIWTHRTWKHATLGLWTLRETKEYIKTKLCARCYCSIQTGLRLENATGCARCVRIAGKIFGSKGNHDLPDLARHPVEAEMNGEVSFLVPPLLHKMDQVWIRKNAHLGGLMDEALDTI